MPSLFFPLSILLMVTQICKAQTVLLFLRFELSSVRQNVIVMPTQHAISNKRLRSFFFTCLTSAEVYRPQNLIKGYYKPTSKKPLKYRRLFGLYVSPRLQCLRNILRSLQGLIRSYCWEAAHSSACVLFTLSLCRVPETHSVHCL